MCHPPPPWAYVTSMAACLGAREASEPCPCVAAACYAWGGQCAGGCRAQKVFQAEGVSPEQAQTQENT